MKVVYLTPAGRLFTQAFASGLSREQGLVLMCGRYEGVDQRVIDAFVTDEISIGDYVLSGGEVAAMAVVDSMARLVPGVITGESLEEESFAQGLLEYPHYTRPEVFRGTASRILLSGHHEKIRRWRLEKSIEKTMKNRPELLEFPRHFRGRHGSSRENEERRSRPWTRMKALEAEQLKENVEAFRIGDTVKVHYKIIEGKTERVQVFEGIVIAMKRDGIRKTFTVRKISYGVGVERIFP